MQFKSLFVFLHILFPYELDIQQMFPSLSPLSTFLMKFKSLFLILILLLLSPDDLDIPKAFGSISFARNHIRSLSSSNFGSSSYLVSLDISENELEGLPARVFAPLQVLSSLNLRNNIISSVDPEVRLSFSVFV